MRDPALPHSGVILRRASAACLLALSPLFGAAACGAPPPPVDASRAPPHPEPPAPPRVTTATAASASSDASAAGAGDTSAAAGGPSACPSGMKLVDTMYCPKVRLKCLKEEHDKPNHITICHKFAEKQTCLVEPRR
jgi:formylglycine-generating enzyme